MKFSLRGLLLIGVLWLGALAFESQVMPAFFLDAILSPRLLATTTPEERTQIQKTLRDISAPGYLSWIGAVAVVVLSGVSLKMSTKEVSHRDEK